MRILKQEWRRLRLVFSFMTTFPFSPVEDFNEQDMARGLVYSPIVGIVIGSFSLIIWWLTSLVLPVQICAILVILSYVIITGGLHLDGLADTCDGVFSNRPSNRMLEIMRDSRIGTNGVIALIMTFLIYWVCISILPPGIFGENIIVGSVPMLNVLPGINAYSALLLWPVAGRIGSIISSGISAYARKEEGLGKSFIDLLGAKEALIGGSIGLVLFFAVSGLIGLVLFSAIVLSTLLATWYFKSKLGGATGDTLGAVCEINQVVFLLLYILIGGL